MDNEVERKSGSTGKKKVMVAIDESECSRLALKWALDNLGETIANSELIIFTVQPIVDFSYAYASTLGAARTFLSALTDFLVFTIVMLNCCSIFIIFLILHTYNIYYT